MGSIRASLNGWPETTHRILQMNKLFNDNFIDSLSIVSFIIGLLNYEENLSQSDKDDIISRSSKDAQMILEQLEKDLDEQNEVLKEIIERIKKLEEKINV